MTPQRRRHGFPSLPLPAPGDHDATPWLLIGAATAVLTIVAGVVAIAEHRQLLVGRGRGRTHRRRRPGRLPLGGPAHHRPRSPAPGARGARRRRARRPGADWRGPNGSPNLLVITAEPVDVRLLRAALHRAIEPTAAVLVVAPAFTRSRLRFWVSDRDEAIARARAIEERSVAALRDDGLAADGHVGAGDPVTAIEDALRLFDPEAILLFLHASGPHRYRERPLRDEVERRFRRPVAQLDAATTPTTRSSR